MRQFCSSILIVLLLVACANAYILHWDDFTSVPDGTLTQDYTNVDGSVIDIRVDWVVSDNMASGYPTNEVGTLGMGSGHWFVNESSGRTVAIVSFSEPVPYCKLDFWEIDGVMSGEPSLTNYIDKVRLKGWDTPYDIAGATYIAPSSYDGGSDIAFIEMPGDATTDSGLNIINGGEFNILDANPANHAWVEYEDAAFQSFAFEFNTLDAARGAVLGDIVFVPEPGTLLLLGLGGLLLRRRR